MTPTHAARPSTAGWLLACLGASTTLLLTAFVLVLGSELYHQLLLERTQKLVADGLFSQAEAELKNYFSPPKFIGLSFNRHSNVSINARDESLALLQSIAAVYRNNINEALRHIPSDRHERFATFRTHLTELDLERDELQRIRSELYRLRGWLDKFPSQYQAIASNFADLLSLTPLKLSPRDPELPLYTSGVLAGLPALHGLPDGLIDFPAFGEALKAANGSVRIEATDQHSALLIRIENIKSDLADAQVERNDTISRIAELEEKERSLSDKTSQSERNLKVEATNFVANSLTSIAPRPLTERLGKLQIRAKSLMSLTH